MHLYIVYVSGIWYLVWYSKSTIILLKIHCICLTATCNLENKHQGERVHSVAREAADLSVDQEAGRRAGLPLAGAQLLRREAALAIVRDQPEQALSLDGQEGRGDGEPSS